MAVAWRKPPAAESVPAGGDAGAAESGPVGDGVASSDLGESVVVVARQPPSFVESGFTSRAEYDAWVADKDVDGFAFEGDTAGGVDAGDKGVNGKSDSDDGWVVVDEADNGGVL